MLSKKIRQIICMCAIISVIGSQTVYAVDGTENNITSSKVEATEGTVPPEKPDGEMPDGAPGGFNVGKGEDVETTGVYLVDGTVETKSSDTITSSVSNESPVKVTNGGTLTLSNATLNKSEGEMTVEEASDFFGANSGLLVNAASTASVEGVRINTSVSGGNAVFATGEGSKITLKNVSINTTGDHSRGLDATYNGEIDADSISINTEGAHCAALATDRGEGTINVNNAVLNTKGEGSPCVYSTGDINVSDATGLSSGSSIAVIEGKNSIEINRCNLTGYAIGRGKGGVDDTGVMIYQSMSGDANSGVGTFSSTESTLSISKESSKYETAPMFFVTNTDAKLNLNNTNLRFGSGILLNVAGNDGEWGKSGLNGGNLEFNAENQILDGNITVDNISTLNLNLVKSSLKSTINSANTAKEINISLDKDSILEVTGTSYVSSIKDTDTSFANIKDNGNTIYYDSTNSANDYLNNGTITLPDGGVLTPAK